MKLLNFKYKICTTCKNLVSNYYADKRASDGLQSRCSTCESLARKTKGCPRKTREQAHRHDIAWKANNPGKKRAHVAKRQIGKLFRVPKWLTKDDFTRIELFYSAAKQLTMEIGIKFEVDHIVPLQGAHVSGLHVPWNLQVIPASENRSKGNKHVT